MAKANRTLAAFQGEPGAFSHAAARKLLGAEVEERPCVRFDDVFRALKERRVSHAVLPMENTLHGSVHENYDHLLEYELPIIGETSIRISHQLIAMRDTLPRHTTGAIPSRSLESMSAFFENHPNIEKVSHYEKHRRKRKDLAAERPPHSAAIASESAAEIYGGTILKRNIEDDRQNFTRFFLLSHKAAQDASKNSHWKTSLVFSTPQHCRRLFKAMACFALRDLNLTKIESRPLRGKPWEYLFYVDLLGHAKHDAVKRAIENLQEITSFLRILGSYQPTE